MTVTGNQFTSPQKINGTLGSPEILEATEKDFKDHVLAGIPAEFTAANGETIKPQEIALEAFKENKARMAANREE